MFEKLKKQLKKKMEKEQQQKIARAHLIRVGTRRIAVATKEKKIMKINCRW